MKKISLLVILLGISLCIHAQVKILFDATKAETAGSADWVIDEDLNNMGWSTGPAVVGGGSDGNAQRYPTPLQSTVTSSTAETYWKGGISYWGIDCVKQGYEVETLPYNGQITYGNGSNVQDLSNYKIFVVCEPNILFTTAEKTAMMNFVQNGGGLYMISDHNGSDRNNDGYDSPTIWNDFMTNNGVQSNPFGISFDLVSITQTTTNLPSLPGDPLLHGSFGNVTEAQWSAGTTMTLSTSANSSVKGVVYKTGSSFGSTNVMVAYATYGSGKVVAFGDSSPFDDGTGDSGDALYTGYTGDAAGNHRPLIMNGTIWMAASSGSVATLTTTTPSSITTATASSGGNISTDGGATVTARGVCWSTASSPVSTGSHTTDGTGTGTFTSSITGLTANTVYHVRAYATNTSGTAYGSDLQFTTLVNPPTITTTAASSITTTTASSGGNVTAGGDAAVTARGVCWSTAASPLVSGSHTTDGTGTGSFTSSITGLTANTLYHVRAYATNTGGTAYGSDLQFTTTLVPTLFVTPSSQSVSATIGSTSFTVTSNSAWTASSDQSWCTVTASGSGNGTITANYTANTLGTRIAYVTVTVTGLTPIVVSVSQAGAAPTLSVTPSSQSVTSAAGSTSFTVTSNSSWAASSDQTWCTVTSSGSGSGTITANYTLNTTFVSRVANVTVTVTGLTPVVVTVTQAAAALPAFVYTMVNDVQTSDRTLEFDLYIYHPDGSSVFELATTQAGITMNSAIYNGGSISIAIVPGTSQLLTAQQPATVNWVQSQNCLKLTPRTPPGAGFGTTISTSSPGTRVCRLRITNSVAFAKAQANLTFSFSTVPYPTKVNQYIGGTNTGITCTTANTYSNCINPVLNPPNTTVNITVLLEGLYAGGGAMNPAYDENGIHWGAGIADKVDVELHSGSDFATTVYSLGNVVLGTNGIASFTIPNTYNGSYYIVVKHRNSITTVTAAPVSFASGPVSYNFTDHASKAYGDNQLMMIDGSYTIFGGDAYHDDLIDSSDMQVVDNDASSTTGGYIATDVNGDGLVDSSDMEIVDNNAALTISAITP